MISIPTIRDRCVLHQLNKFLSSAFPECVPHNIANFYIRIIADDLLNMPPSDTFICGCDIKAFYDHLRQDYLLSLVEKRIGNLPVHALIRQALLTPTVPTNVRRSHYKTFKPKYGVPQGIAISNILAGIYLRDVDASMNKMDVKYFRYVDDVLIYGKENQVREAHDSLRKQLDSCGLSLHPIDSGKSHMGPLTSTFGYLGYTFTWPVVTVRETTIERFLQSLSAKFSEHIHNKNHLLRKFKYLTEENLSEIFIIELNERITGAISEKRRYGWISYFSQINDMTLLFRLDHIISKMFKRLKDFNHIAPIGLKTLHRSYFEMKFNPAGGYVHNYDSINSRGDKLKFLLERGRLAPEDKLSDNEIHLRYEAYRRKMLAAMHLDEGEIYG